MPDFDLVPVDHDPFGGGPSPVVTSGQPPTFADRLYVYGAPADEAEDRRADPRSGYGAMQANTNMVGAAVRHFYPILRDFDLNLPQPKYQQRQPGKLSEQAGYYDIPSVKMPWSERLKKDFDYTFYGMDRAQQ